MERLGAALIMAAVYAAGRGEVSWVVGKILPLMKDRGEATGVEPAKWSA